MKKRLFTLFLLPLTVLASQLNEDGYIRAMYLGDKASTAAAVGGSVGISPTFGWLQSRVAFYGVSPVGAKEDAVSALFSDKKEGYALLGEAALGYKNDSLSVLVGRQKVTTPLADADDGRVVPNLYEGVSLKYAPTDKTKIEAYYLTRISGFWSTIFGANDMSQFVTISKASGYGDVTPNAALWSAGVTHELQNQRISAWVYHTPNLIDLAFAEYSAFAVLAQGVRVQLSIQGSKQGSNGRLKEFLESKDKSLSQDYAAVKLEASHHDATVSFAATRVNDSSGKMDSNMMNIWAGIPQYTVTNEFVMKSFNTDGAKMYKTQFGYLFTPQLDAKIGYLYFDGLAKAKVKDESVVELIVSAKNKNLSLNGVLLLHGVNNESAKPIFKSTLEYRF